MLLTLCKNAIFMTVVRTLNTTYTVFAQTDISFCFYCQPKVYLSPEQQDSSPAPG